MSIESWGRSIKISMTIIGTSIGAGFASGREIWEFFGSYGQESHWGILLAMLLFFSTSVVILWLSWKYQTYHYSQVLNQLMGKTMTKLFDGFVLIYLFTTTLVMIAGSGAAFAEWNRPYLEGIIVTSIAVIIVLCFDIKGLMTLNTLVMPLLIVGLLFVCFQFLLHPQPQVPLDQEKDFILPVWPSAVTYAAFNTISLIAVLSTMGKEIRYSKEIWWSAWISACFLGVLALMYNYSLLQINHLMSQYEIPLFALVQNYSPLFLFLITCVLWFAIYTTIVSNLHGLVFRLSARFPFPRWLWGLLILLVLIPFSQFGFSSLVQVLYPLYGVLNLFLLAVILLYPVVK